MTDRERLLEILNKPIFPHEMVDPLEAVSDYLLDNDVVPVVRCKDCKHFCQTEIYDPDECMKWKVRFGVAYTTPDGYCHKAERKGND